MHDLLCNCGDAHLKNLKILFRSIWRPFVMDNRPFFHPRQTDKCKSLLFKHNTTHLCFSLLHLCKLSSASSTGFRGRTSSFLWKLFPQVTRSGKAGNVRSGRSRECVCVRVWERGEADQRLTVTVHWLEMWNQSWDHIPPRRTGRLGRAEWWFMDQGDLVLSGLAAEWATEIERVAKAQGYEQGQWSDSDREGEKKWPHISCRRENTQRDGESCGFFKATRNLRHKQQTDPYLCGVRCSLKQTLFSGVVFANHRSTCVRVCVCVHS